MSNFGFTELRLVNPYDVAFKEARSAVRAHYILEQAQVFSDLADAVRDCSLIVGTTAVGHRDLRLPLHSLESAGSLIDEHLSAEAPAALLFGSEKFGLSNEDMSHCHWLLRIPTREEHSSMNLGQAVSICLYELTREQSQVQKRFEPQPPASAEEGERFTTILLDLLTRSGYVREHTEKTTEIKIRRLVKRMGPPAGDAETWLGILRQILWKIRQSD